MMHKRRKLIIFLVLSTLIFCVFFHVSFVSAEIVKPQSGIFSYQNAEGTANATASY